MGGAVFVFQIFYHEDSDQYEDDRENVAHLAKGDGEQRIYELSGYAGHRKKTESGYATQNK